MAGGKLISTGVEFPDATTQTTSGLPLTGGTMTGTIAGFTSTGIDDNATSTAITIDASENVGIGTNAPANVFHVKKDVDDFICKIENDGNSTSSDGLWIDTRWNTATNTMLKVTTNSGGTEIMRVTVDGLTFNGDTAAANALDDYEAGTWTPTVEGDATGVLAAPTNSCYYTKIGNTVHIVGSIRVTTNFTANVIGGLPYATSYAASPSSVISLCNPLTSTSDDITMGASRTTTKVLFYNDQSVASDHNLNTISGYYRFSFSYRTA